MNLRCPLRSIVASVLIALSVPSVLAAAQQGDPFAGSWQGTIETPGSPLDVEVDLAREDGSWSGTIDIPAQNAFDLPLENVEVGDDEARFTIGGIAGSPTFEGRPAEGAIEGTFTQGGQSFPFRLERAPVDGGDGAAEDEGASGAADGGDAREPSSGSGDGAAAAGGPLGPAARSAAEAAETYEDPEGRFTLPVPTGWSVEERDGVATLTSPDEGIVVHAMALPGNDPEDALGEAWRRVDPQFDLGAERVQEPPATGGIEEAVQITYETEEDRIVQGVAQLHEGTVYVLLVDASLAAAQRRSSQIGIISSGFTIAAVEEDDLTGRSPRELDDELLSELEAYVDDALERFGVPGAAVAVVQDGRVVFAEGFGNAGPDGRPVTPETLMMIGSTTKTMTTLMMATLVDEGHMDWDTPVVEVLPEFEVADAELTRTITMENLVCACTGVPRRDLELFFRLEELDAEEVVRSLRDFEFFTDFGEAFQYSNQMVATGGYAAAAAGGAEFGRLHEGYVERMRENVLGPIGLPYSTFSFEEVQERGDWATPHGLTRDLSLEPIPLSVEEFVTPVAPAGALWSNVIDMGRYLITLMNDGVAPDGRRVVSAEALHHTWRPQVPVSADASYGLGWIVDEYKGIEQLHHGGNTLGFTSDLAFLPEVDLGISVITNGRLTTAFNQAVRFRLFELAFELEHEFDAQATFLQENLHAALGDATEGAQDGVDGEAVEPWLGRYTNPALGEVELSLDGDRLTLDAGAFTTSVLPVEGEERYVTVDEPAFGQSVRLSEDEEGEPILLFGEGALEYRFERTE